MQKKLPSKEGFVCLGVIIGAHGIKGELRFKSFADTPTDLAAYGPLLSFKNDTFNLSNLRYAGKTLIGRAEHVTNRNDAEALKGTYLFVPADLVSGEESITFVGYPVFDENDQELGVVDHIFNNGAHDVVSIRKPDGELALVPDVEDATYWDEEKLIILEDALVFFTF